MQNPLTYRYRGYAIQYLGSADDLRRYQVAMPGNLDYKHEQFLFDSNWDHAAAIADITSWIDISDPESPAG